MTHEPLDEPRKGTVIRAAVLGSPISHSKSPLLHRAAYRAAGLDWRYDAIDVSAEHLPELFATLSPRWAGLSLTMPLKEAVIPLLDHLDDTAALTGAVNTVVLPGSPCYDGETVGYNTDVAGIVAALNETVLNEVAQPGEEGELAASGGDLRIDSLEILGAGATARSAALAGRQMGATELTVRARRAEAAEEFGEFAKSLGYTRVLPMGLSDGPLGGAEVTISTLPSGAADDLVSGEGSTVDQGGALATSARLLLDVVYDPWPTALAAAWPGPVTPGISMLLWQAVAQVRLMTGVEPDVAAMRAAVTD